MRSLQPVRLVTLTSVDTAAQDALSTARDSWTTADRATAARVLSHQLTELLAEYGAAVVFDALATSLRADLEPAAQAMHAPKLAAAYWSAASIIEGTAAHLDRMEQQQADSSRTDR